MLSEGFYLKFTSFNNNFGKTRHTPHFKVTLVNVSINIV